MGTYIIIFGVFVLLILVLAFRTYPIEEIRDYRGKIVSVIYQKRINQFLDKLKQSFSLLDAFTINATWNQLKKMVYGNENDENPTGKKMISTNFLFDLYNYFTAFELEWIEKNQIPFKQRELYFLSELYLHIAY